MNLKRTLLAASAAAALATLTACGGGGSDTTSASQEVLDKLTVKTIDEGTCESDASGLVPFDISSLKGLPPRVWSDAISTPVSNENDPAIALNDVRWAICHDPVLGITWAHALAGVKVGDTTIGDLNDWLKPYQVDAGEISEQAAGFIPLLDASAADKTPEKVEAAVSKNGEYQALAQRVNTLINRFWSMGIHSPMSEWNYHLAVGGAVVGKLPEVELNDKQENLKSVVLVLTEKGDSCPIVAIGANVYDKRPEGFPTGCDDKGKPRVDVPVPGNPGGGTPPGTGGGNPPPSNPPGTEPPPPPHITTTPPPPPPNDGKIPTLDPYPRGNAPQGGGPNATPGPGIQLPYTPPPAAPYTPPPAPAYTPPPAPPVITQQPAATQPQVVVPSQQPPNNGTVVPQPGGDFG